MHAYIVICCNNLLKQSILGARLKALESNPAVLRGKKLEEEVIKQLSKDSNMTLRRAGLCVMPCWPIFGASPDAVTDKYVVEVKCPFSSETKRNYVVDGKPSPKRNAQIQLQICFKVIGKKAYYA